MHKEAMSGICRWLKLKSEPAMLSGRRTTTSMPNIISDRCRRIQQRHRRLRAFGLTVPLSLQVATDEVIEWGISQRKKFESPTTAQG
jgi:hypothetical protein